MLYARNDIERETADCDNEKCFPDEPRREHKGQIKVLWQECHANDVDEKRDDFREDHVDVPAGKRSVSFHRRAIGRHAQLTKC